MTDIEDRIRGFAAAIEPVDVGAVRRRVEVRSRNRRLVAGGACVVLVAGLASGLVAITRDGGSTGVPPIDSAATTNSVTESTNATTTTHTATTTTETTAVVAAAGSGVGPYLDPASLPQGWAMTMVMSTDLPPSGSGSAEVRSDLMLARYNADRTQIVETIHIQLKAFDQKAQRRSDLDNTGIDTVVHGLPAYQLPTGIDWVEDGFVIDVSQPFGLGRRPQLDQAALLDVAEGVSVGPGTITATALPVGFEVLERLDGRRQAEGPQHDVYYATNHAPAGGEVGLRLSVIADAGAPAEVMLADFPAAYAVERAGHRMIVFASGADLVATVEVRWDQPDGSQVQLVYGAPLIDTTRDEIVAEALQLAGAVRLADADQWAQFERDSVAAAASLEDREWARTALADRGLNATETPRVEGVGTGALVTFAPSANAAGEPVGVCEFLFRTFVGCTVEDATGLAAAADVQVMDVGSGVFRVMSTNDITQVTVQHNGRGPMFGGITNLFAKPSSPLVIYVRLDPDDGPACLRFSDVDGVERTQRGVVDGVVTPSCDA